MTGVIVWEFSKYCYTAVEITKPVHVIRCKIIAVLQQIWYLANLIFRHLKKVAKMKTENAVKEPTNCVLIIGV